MDIEKVLQKLEIPKEGIFYKCPYCDYKNVDKKVVVKHIKSKHQDELKKEVEKMNKKQQQKKKQQAKKKPQKKQKQNTEIIEYKDYIYLFAHKKTCMIILEDGTTIKGLVKAKDRYTIMVLNSDYIPKGFDKPPERIILHKGHIVSVIPLEENKNE
ncbi:C2H2-type zinc finger protein [Methanocaldococcus sp.]|uniref:C2H2-type zinc finger protein n=1 Tax=Methanocaldococcus sp. TaxID=2152917 RepID=UPI00260D0FF5|nr:C2H2-type zinc finger protein [Methanocaldococcus sp.]MCQ6253550.1 C2H2-type zinc finger protein [Methanocaldococcus sp.]